MVPKAETRLQIAGRRGDTLEDLPLLALRAVRPRLVGLFLVLASCGPSIGPGVPGGAPSPRASSTATASVDKVPADDTSVTPAVLPALVLPDSLNASVDAAMLETGKALGLADSILLARTTTATQVDSANGEAEVTWDIDVTSFLTHDRVARYVTLFSGPAKDRIQLRLVRGKKYEPMIREKFRAAGIPEDMYYLGLVESGYDPHAYSRAAAVGMWQFMSSTARGVGLRVDWWVDERRDPVRATDAAARFLTDLHKQFGSYYLAAAAYNGGPGRVSRGLSRFQDELEESVGDARFFALAEQSYLRAETRNYVPQLIAAALIGKTPERYGMVVPDSVERFGYDSVQVPELISLGAVARASGASVTDVRDLNPHFLRGATPPKYAAWVRVPTGHAVGFDSAFLAIPDSERVGFTRVKSTKGQTLKTIATKHGVEARQLAWYNPGVSSTKKLSVGKELLVPSRDVIAGSRDVPDPSIEIYGSSSRGSGRLVHTVRRGESLGSIAKRYKVSVASLTRANGLKKTVVYPGQTIIVRGGSASRGRAVASRRATSASKKKAVASRRAPAAKKKVAPR